MKKPAFVLFIAMFLWVLLSNPYPSFALEPVSTMPTNAVIYVNSQLTEFNSYNINGNNYFKLRDLAYALNGSEKQFAVEWAAAANSILLTGNKPYNAVGGEMAAPNSLEAKQALPTTAAVILNGQPLTISAYNIEGNNYFKLRDIAQAFDFCVAWDADARIIYIDTKQPYIAESDDQAGGEDVNIEDDTTALAQSIPDISAGYAAEVVRLVNAERAKQGLPALIINDKLAAAAQLRAEEILVKFDHTRPDGKGYATVLEDFDIWHAYRGENIGLGQASPDRLMAEWMASAGHRNNILGDYTQIGVGLVKNKGVNSGYAWVLLLVK
jgi:uncharacterized protein YkwD